MPDQTPDEPKRYLRLSDDGKLEFTYDAPEDEQTFKIAPPEVTWTGHIPLEQLGFWKELIWRARARLN